MYTNNLELEVPSAKPLPLVAPNLYVCSPTKVEGYFQFPVLHAVQFMLSKFVVYREGEGIIDTQKTNYEKTR